MATGGHLQATSDENIEYECTVCLKNNKIKNADRFCFDCQKYMCSECLRIHNTFIETHNVLSVTDKKVQNVLTEKCGDHPDKLLELYCRQHDVVLCQTCLLLDHRTCSNVKDIVELSDPDIHAIDSHLQYSLDHLNQVINALDTHLGHIQQKEESNLNELEDYARKILSKIKELKSRGKDDISATTRQLKSMAEEHLHACEKLKDDLSKYTKEISSANKRNAHVFVLQNKSQAITRRIESLCRDSERMIKEATFSFRLNLQVAAALYDFNSLLVKGEKYECIRVIRCNIKLPKDELECDIRGCCRLGDGSLLLVDGNNKRLKRVYPNSSAATEHYDMTDSPSDVCIISPHEVAGSTTDFIDCADKRPKINKNCRHCMLHCHNRGCNR